jgi:hypothetical protein
MPDISADYYPSFLLGKSVSEDSSSPHRRPVPSSYRLLHPDDSYDYNSAVPYSPLKYSSADFALDRAAALQRLSDLYYSSENLSPELQTALASKYNSLVSEDEEIHDLFDKMPGLFESVSENSSDYDSYMSGLAKNYSLMDRAYKQAVGRLGDQPPLNSYASHSYPLYNIYKNVVEGFKDYFNKDDSSFKSYLNAQDRFSGGDTLGDKLSGFADVGTSNPVTDALSYVFLRRPVQLYPYHEGENSSSEEFPSGVFNPYLSLGTGTKGSSLVSYAWENLVNSLNDPISRGIYSHNKLALPLNPMSKEQFAKHYFSDFDPDVNNDAATNREFERALYFGVDPLTDEAEVNIPRGRALGYDRLVPYTLAPTAISWAPNIVHGLADFATFPLEPGTMSEMSLANRYAIGPLSSLISSRIPSALSKASNVSGKLSDLERKTWNAMETGDSGVFDKLANDSYVSYLTGADGASDFSFDPLADQSFYTRALGLDKHPNKLFARTFFPNSTDASVLLRNFEPYRSFSDASIATRSGLGRALYKKIPDRFFHDFLFLSAGSPFINSMSEASTKLFDPSSDPDNRKIVSPDDEYSFKSSPQYLFDNNTDRNRFSYSSLDTSGSPKQTPFDLYKSYVDYFKPYYSGSFQDPDQKIPSRGLDMFVPSTPSYDPGEFVLGRKPNHNKKK